MRLPILLVLVVVLLCVSRSARAERDLIVPFEEGGHLVLDQLAGMRVDAVSGAGYAGPVGVSSHDDKSDGGNESKTTTLWLAPSADLFVTDHLSLGGTIEVAHTWGSVKSGASGESRLELPGTTTLSFVPRVGFYVAVTDRIGIWPRVGFGWTSVESAYVSGGAVATDMFKAMLLDADLGLVYRFHETFFMKAGPEITTTLGGEHSAPGAGSGSSLQVSAVLGFGMNIEL